MAGCKGMIQLYVIYERSCLNISHSWPDNTKICIQKAKLGGMDILILEYALKEPRF